MDSQVFKQEPYNDKVDVFSFGVVLYELLARSALIFSELPDGSLDGPERYAGRVAAGYRWRTALRTTQAALPGRARHTARYTALQRLYME